MSKTIDYYKKEWYEAKQINRELDKENPINIIYFYYMLGLSILISFIFVYIPAYLVSEGMKYILWMPIDYLRGNIFYYEKGMGFILMFCWIFGFYNILNNMLKNVTRITYKIRSGHESPPGAGSRADLGPSPHRTFIKGRHK